MADIREYLTTSQGTEGSLLIPKTIYNQLVEAAKQTILPREMALYYIGPDQIQGSSVDVDLADDNSVTVNVIAEAADAPVSVATFTSTNLKPVKYGCSPKITKEMIEDGKFNQVDLHVRLAGQRMAENETSLVITALDGASTTVSGGAALTIANINSAIQTLKNAYRLPTDIILGTEAAMDLRNIDTFVEANKSGSDQTLRQGIIGKIFGCNVWEVANAGMTATSAYVLDRNWAYAIAEKRPITVEQWDDQSKDLTNIKVTQRVKVAALRTNSIVKITTS